MTSIRPLAAVALAAVALVLLRVPEARAEEPSVRYPPSSVRPKVIVAGLGIAGVAYGAAFLGAEATQTTPGSTELKIPVIGPWLALGPNACPPDEPGCDGLVYLRAGLLVVDGLLQAAGLAIVAEGIAMTTEATPAAPVKPVAAFTWRPAPFVTPTVTGIGFVGTF